MSVTSNWRWSNRFVHMHFAFVVKVQLLVDTYKTLKHNSLTVPLPVIPFLRVIVAAWRTQYSFSRYQQTYQGSQPSTRGIEILKLRAQLDCKVKDTFSLLGRYYDLWACATWLGIEPNDYYWVDIAISCTADDCLIVRPNALALSTKGCRVKTFKKCSVLFNRSSSAIPFGGQRRYHNRK